MNAFGYYGGKYSKLSWLLPQLDTPHQTYCELFAGSLAVMLNKPRVKHEIANDLAGEVADFWKAMRECPDELIRLIHCSPRGEAEFKRIIAAPPTDDLAERGRRFYVRIAGAFSNVPTGLRSSMQHAFRSDVRRRELPLVAERLRNVIVENTTAVRLMRRAMNQTKDGENYSPILFYADPPYVHETRNGSSVYIEDEFDHDEFLDAVTALPPYAKMCISGYAHPLYDDRLTADAGWHRHEFETHASSKNAKGIARRTEVIWRNYDIIDRQSVLDF